MEDFTTDQVLAYVGALAKRDLLPRYMKEGSIPEPEDLKDVPSHSFGDDVARLFPVNTKAAAYLSLVDLAHKGQRGTPVWERVKEACEAHGVLEDAEKGIAALTVAPAPQNKEAAETPREFALELDHPDGTRTQHYPMNGSHETEESLLKIAGDMREESLPRSWFASAAGTLLKRARELGLSEQYAPREVRRLGESRVPDLALAEKQVLLRQKQAGFGDDWVALYKEAIALVEEDPSQAMEAAYAWELADLRHKIAYDQGSVIDPVRTFHSGVTLRKIAKEASNRFALCDTLVPLAALKTVPNLDLATHFEPEVARAVCHIKAASTGVAATAACEALDPDDQKMLSHLILRHASNAAA